MSVEGRHVGIIGLGLIGGSIARDLLSRGFEITAYDRDRTSMAAADDADLSAIHLVDTPREVLAAPLVIVAVPVRASIAVLGAIAPGLSTSHIVFDVGSTKREIVACAESCGVGHQFVGCHPLTGDHQSGWQASRRGLFNRAPVFLCPGPRTPAHTVHTVHELWTLLGANPEVMTPEAHDERVAWISHLPHMISAVLALALRGAGIERAQLGPGGRDMTRLAGGSPELWTDIAVQNAKPLLRALVEFERRLADVRGSIHRSDDGSVHESFRTAAEWFSG